MKSFPALSLSIAALSFTIFTAATTPRALAQNSAPATAQTDDSSPRAMHEALKMAPARAALTHSLVSDKLKPGDTFSATLSHKVQLQNGPELPSGTVLIGQVSADDMNAAGTSKLALRFTQAKLKDGQTIPIKATIVGIVPPANDTVDATPLGSGDEVGGNWNDGTLAVEVVGAAPGVDLHSRIASKNSGVFTSTKSNMKLASGTELQLAVAQQKTTTDTNGNE
jgi:hypothetical protein